MASKEPQFTYAASLQEYMIPESTYCQQHGIHMLVCGAVVFDEQGRLLLVRRAEDEKAFPSLWEIPGGKVDDTDETILHALVREVQEETELKVTRVVRKAAEFGWEDYSKRRQRHEVWWKLIFEVEVEQGVSVKLDPIEHQDYVFATEEEIRADQMTDGVALRWISAPNKEVNLKAFQVRRDALGHAAGDERHK
ncbi:hypothetical protein M011DRAFT_400032 [Sporormia fimetaria CBS 119925]|uniref:Nudix hydrolase domain-containing protein n=1 Tax=Sporormia fimetaria CBS 119925 TaxID=1340428 RepID=A0A6A6VHF8_9PLEO|nr:hypothetical protein M011DRAFT_400032 [Sporormia fimetaria CBS 119925]